ncbi:helix-turn-helix domain-containing protein [Streptomyces sp. NPDC045431]|uniref:TetR/AcrR family transcriptional regulator n=1 Tax=Streptomyces sp. NPDC045431 TaxID=3155613 RepID=UPI003410018C
MVPPARQRILDATARLIREHGVARLTTRQIAEAADAAEGSITKNFGGKAGLLRALFSEELPELRAWQAAATPPGRRPLRAALTDLIARGIDYYTAALPLLAMAQADHDLLAAHREADAAHGTGLQLAIDQITAYLTACQDAGQITPSADPYALAITLCGAADLQAYTEHLAGPGALRGTREHRVAALVDTLLPAAAPPVAPA